MLSFETFFCSHSFVYVSTFFCFDLEEFQEKCIIFIASENINSRRSENYEKFISPKIMQQILHNSFQLHWISLEISPGSSWPRGNPRNWNCDVYHHEDGKEVALFSDILSNWHFLLLCGDL